jgi:hypothetical protein
MRADAAEPAAAPPAVPRQPLLARLAAPRHPVIWLVVASLLPSLLLFALNGGDPAQLARHWDGPNYIEVAKTLYHVPVDHPLAAWTTPAYFACHLPLFPLLMRALAFVGYPMAMLLVTWASAAGATVVFYRLLQAFACVRNPFVSALLMTLLPLRWVLYKTVGATEPLFLLLVFGSLLAYRRDRLGWAIALAALAGVTRITGVLMAAVYFIELVRTRRYAAIALLPLIGLPLLATFVFYHYHFGDFWAYFSWNAKLISPVPMASIWRSAAVGYPVGAEFYLLLYAVLALGVWRLRRHPLLCAYAAVYFVFNLFILHQDLSRYFLPIAHLALLVGYDRLWRPAWAIAALPLLLAIGVAVSALLLPHNSIDAATYRNLLQQPAYP